MKPISLAAANSATAGGLPSRSRGHTDNGGMGCPAAGIAGTHAICPKLRDFNLEAALLRLVQLSGLLQLGCLRPQQAARRHQQLDAACPRKISRILPGHFNRSEIGIAWCLPIRRRSA